MAKPNKPETSTSRDSSIDDNNNVKTKRSSNPKEFKPHNMFLATKYHNDNPDQLVLLHFDDAIMKALGLQPKATK